VLRLTEEDLEIDFERFKKEFQKIRSRIFKLKKKGRLMTQEVLDEKSSIAIRDGLKNLGMYHAKRPLIEKDGKVIVQDVNTLYYYHNRLNGYGLEAHI
jgi:glycerol-3-phosphate O-acyltransferase